MAGYVSLNSSIRTCKIDPAYASKIESDRFLNPGNMVCPPWTGYDSAGRPACPNSFMTKNAGCNSAQDRVLVENIQRPQYIEYVNLSSNGIKGEMFGTDVTNPNIVYSSNELQNINNTTGNFGIQFASTNYPGCGAYNYIRGMQQNQEAMRQYSSYINAYNSNMMRDYSGC